MDELKTRVSEQEQQLEVARTLARGLSMGERASLAAYVQALSSIRGSNSHPMVKAKEAWAATLSSDVLWPVARTILEEIKRHGWDERGMKGRAGIATSVAAMAVFGSQGAGIAALGGAIGVPLWLVFGAGGAFLAGLYEELHKESALEPQRSTPAANPPGAQSPDVVASPIRKPPSPLLPAPARDGRRTIMSGDVIGCLQCSRERTVTQEWLDQIATTRCVDSVSRYGLQSSHLKRLKCAECGSRALEVRRT